MVFSGCGKSTALNLICGLEKPSDGKIFFGDTDVTLLPPENRGVGLVFQNYALYPHLTVYDNIKFPLENLRGKNKLTKEQMDSKIKEVAKLVQIETLLERKPNEMSGGQQQRVAIARALVKRPEVLLLDEPLSNLDARLRLQTREELKRIQLETGITTVFVTHDQEEAMSISDTIVVMKEGVLQQMGEPQAIYDEPVNLFVASFLGTPQINVFKGEIKDEKVYVGQDIVKEAKGQSNREVYVAIRPEGFVLDPNGQFICDFVNREVMGRDTSFVFTHGDLETDKKKAVAIIPSDEVFKAENGKVRFALKPKKVHVFDGQTTERIDL